MRSIRFTLLLIFLLFSASIASAQERKLPDNVWNGEMESLKGKPFHLSDGQAKVKIVFLWAPWCGPCRLLATKLNKINRAYARRGVEIIGLLTEDQKSDLKDVRAFVRKFKIKYKLGWSNQEMIQVAKSTNSEYSYVLPTMLVLTRGGQVTKRYIGYDYRNTPKRLIDEIKRLLDSPELKDAQLRP